MQRNTNYRSYAQGGIKRAPSQELIQYLARAKHETATVVTMLEPEMRVRLDAAAVGSFATIHADSVTDAFRAARSCSARAVIISPSLLERHDLPLVGRLVMRCPGVMTVALVSENAPYANERLLDLGACGVQRVLDVREQGGWNGLRSLVADNGGDAGALILGALNVVLDEANEETRRFFAVLVRSAPKVPSVEKLAQSLNIRPSTFISRFFRASLPSPRRYLIGLRLLYATAFLETEVVSIADVAHQLEYSSPQSFGRHVRLVMGMSASAFRRDYSFTTMLDQYLSRLVVPFRKIFLWFDPLSHARVLANQKRCDARCTSGDEQEC